MFRCFPLLLSLVLLLCGCGAESAPAAASSAPEPVMLEAGVWPDHPLAEGIPQPEDGKIDAVWVTADDSALSVTVEELDYDGLTDYLETLNGLGFTTVSFTREDGTTCGLLTDGETAFSFTHLGEQDLLNFALYEDNS